MDSPLPLHTVDQVRAIEAHALRALGLSSYELMGRAGAAAWAFVHKRWPAARRLGVLCGPGNNGGDGYVFARLAEAAGCHVELLCAGTPRTPEAARARDEWFAAGGLVRDFDGRLPAVDLWVDALYGIGLNQPLSGLALAMVECLNATGVPILALDVPSGMDADRGTGGTFVKAEAVLSFICAKRGLYTGQGRSAAVYLDRLGLPVGISAEFPAAAMLYHCEHLRLGLPHRDANSHKGSHGHVLCIGGEAGMGGAVRLCAEAALRSGAGLVSVATRAEGVAAMLGARPELMVHAIDDAAALHILLRRADVLAVGPGLGRGNWGRALWEEAIASAKPLVLDADGLNILCEQPRPLPQAILTPHPGEAARMLGLDSAHVQADRFAAAELLARQFECVVVLKGAGTLVAAPGETTVVIGAGNPGMAAGGMGDVLTGVIAALKAQGLASFQAAVFGALLHSAAGDAATQADGERGLLPSDLFAQLRRLANP